MSMNECNDVGNRRRHRRLIRFSTAAALLCSLTGLFFNRTTMISGRRLEGELFRPVIYTFYNVIEGEEAPAGMTLSSHDKLIRVWVETWKQAGWEPRILTLQDATQHPDFDRYNNLLSATGASPYDRLCFLRWLAMANHGGWMSDYDVLPLHDFRREGTLLPNGGYLTVHNRVCPSLVSGSRWEWERVGKAIMEYAAANRIDTDQKTLAKLNHQEPPVYRMGWSVTQQMFNSTTARQWNTATCQGITPNSMRAAHFAHSVIRRAVREGNLPQTQSVENRPDLAWQWWNMWIQTCGPPQRFEEDPQLLTQTLRKPFATQKTPSGGGEFNMR